MLLTVCVVFRKMQGWVVDPSVFTCISMLARAMGPEMTANVKELLESMFATGLRLVSLKCISVHCFHIPFRWSVIMYTCVLSLCSQL